MTEDQIERKVERVMNNLDAQLMSYNITQEQYDREVMLLDKWAQMQLDHSIPAPIRRAWA